MKLYGTPLSRAYRCSWLLRELDVEFEHIPVHSAGESKKPEYLALNPNGRVPALVDGELVLWESMAINLYLVKKYGGALAPRSLEEEAQVLKWTFWAVTECEASANAILWHRVTWPEPKREEHVARQAEASLARPLAVLDKALVGRDYLLGERFTVADLNVAAVLSPAKAGRMEFTTFANVERWLRACFDRPAQRAALRQRTASAISGSVQR